MEQQRDPQIPCADCGASFVFSAQEAAVFAERGLSPPKRCKDCRRARKERGTQAGGNGHTPSWAGRGAPRHTAPRRYTGDVNEYRSPMQDSFGNSAYGMPARGGGNWQGSGEYRSPMQDGAARRGRPADPHAPRPPREGNFRPGAGRHGGGRPRGAPGGEVAHDHGGGNASPSGGQPTPRPARKRPPAELFPITCNTCGAQAEVPFKPAEGREVYCPTCYRARRPSS